MFARSAKSIVWLWVFTLLISTVGISVRQIYCYCVGKTTIALFSGDERCAAETAKTVRNCCRVPGKQPSRSCCEGKKTDEHGCTKKTTRFIQLKTEYTVQEKQADPEPVPAIADLPPVVALPLFTRSEVRREPVVNVSGHPPPLSGRLICLRHGVFRC